MGERIVADNLGEWRAASAANGTALSTTAAFIQLPLGTKHIMMIARNFVTAVVARIALNPYLAVLFTQDNLATVVDTADTRDAQDATTATVVTLNSWDTLANQDMLLLGAHLPFRGVRVIIVNTNSNASVLTVQYWNGTAWTAVAGLSDGTALAGATFGQTGNITFTVPTDWVPETLRIIATPAPVNIPYHNERLYWLRLTVSAVMDATVSAEAILSMNRSTAYMEIPSGIIVEEEILNDVGGIGNIEALVDAGTGNLIVNAFTGPVNEAFV